VESQDKTARWRVVGNASGRPAASVIPEHAENYGNARWRFVRIRQRLRVSARAGMKRAPATRRYPIGNRAVPIAVAPVPIDTTPGTPLDQLRVDRKPTPAHRSGSQWLATRARYRRTGYIIAEVTRQAASNDPCSPPAG
jgi:hypothetical protein